MGDVLEEEASPGLLAGSVLNHRDIPASVLMPLWVSTSCVRREDPCKYSPLPQKVPIGKESGGLVVFAFLPAFHCLCQQKQFFLPPAGPLPPAWSLQMCETGGFTALVRSNTSRASSGCHFPPLGTGDSQPPFLPVRQMSTHPLPNGAPAEPGWGQTQCV